MQKPFFERRGHFRDKKDSKKKKKEKSMTMRVKSTVPSGPEKKLSFLLI